MIKSILKGIVMGLANIIPGVSGGTMAVSMGIYDKLIYSISHLFSDLKKNILFLLPIFVGMGIAIICSSFGIEYLFQNYPLQTNFLFIGLVLGSLPIIHKKVKGNKIKIGHMISFVIFFVLVTILALMNGTEGAEASLTFTFANVIKLFGVGIIASATMIIPGVSGSMMLLLMGYYNPILTSINDFIRALTSFDMEGILKGFGILVPFGIGVVIGIFAVAKLIEMLLQKFPLYTYWGIMGLIIASPFAILIVGTIPSLTIVNVLVSVVTFAAGTLVALKLGE